MEMTFAQAKVDECEKQVNMDENQNQDLNCQAFGILGF